MFRKLIRKLAPKELTVVSHYSLVRKDLKEEIIPTLCVNWKEIKRSFVDNISVMIDYLVKIYYFHDFEEYLSDWINSVRRGFECCPMVERKKKFPTEKKLFDFVWDERLDKDIYRFHKNAVEEINLFYSDVPKKISVGNCDGFEKFFLAYLKLLSHSLSENGAINTLEIRDFVENWDYGFSLKD